MMRGITYYPKAGTILLCRYEGFEKPEMVKPRPVVVVSPHSRTQGLVTVVALSTTPPLPVLEWHHKILLSEPLAPRWPELEVWAKCDMVNTFSTQRLDRFHARVGNQRKYYDRRVSDADLKSIRNGNSTFLGAVSDFTFLHIQHINKLFPLYRKASGLKS